MEHIQVYVNLGFWKPCVWAKNITPEQAAEIQAGDAILTSFFAIIGNVISYVLTPIPATPPTTLADVLTAD